MNKPANVLDVPVSLRVVRRLALAHCARGPARCARCRAMDREVFCLIALEPPDRGRVARRMLEVVIDGEPRCVEYDVERVFDDEAQARAYAAEHGLRFEP